MKKIKYLLLLFIIFLILILCFIFSNKLNTQKNSTELNYSIPKVYFSGDISGMQDKKDERRIQIKYQDENTSFDAYSSIKVQGTSSLYYEKKNYTINLYEDYDLSKKKSVDVGWGKQSKYCLKANWIDKTHARNIVTAKLASEVQAKYDLFNSSPNNGLIDGFPVEIYINDEFLGIYTWNIPKDAWMFNMDEDNKNHIVFVGESWEDPVNFKAPATYGPWDTEVGRGDEEDLAKLNRLVNFVNNSSDKTFKETYNQYLNLDSTINYIILMEFANLIDNAGKNMLIATYDGDIWYPTLYDLDTSWGTNYDGLTTIDYALTVFVKSSKLWTRTLDNFSEEIYSRYQELRKDILTKEHIMKLFNDFKTLIPEESLKKENERWNNIPGYDYTQIDEFLDTRIPIVDKFFENVKNKSY